MFNSPVRLAATAAGRRDAGDDRLRTGGAGNGSADGGYGNYAGKRAD